MESQHLSPCLGFCDDEGIGISGGAVASFDAAVLDGFWMIHKVDKSKNAL